MNPPSSQALMRAIETLYSLNALNSEGAITSQGKLLAELPLEPQLAKCVLTSPLYMCVPEILTIVAMLSVPSVFTRSTTSRKGLARNEDEFVDDDEQTFIDRNEDSMKLFADPESDHITLLNMYELSFFLINSYNAYQRVREEDKMAWCQVHSLNHRNLNAAYDIREQLCNLIDRMHLPVNSNIVMSSIEKKRNIKKCLTHGFFMQSAIFDHDGNYLTAKDNQVYTCSEDLL